ncbi:pilus assembly protein Flp/PilA [Paraburkholderia sp. GAS199]|uniref:Flp family type IVb pilin n=1 Tax=Paraburkholderia sp. GAS199 TaxID=3035126 RepID=UPI003D1A5715
MKKFTQRFLRESKGVTAIEYGLIAGLIVLVISVAVGNIGTNLNTVLGDIANAIHAPAA